MTAAASSPSITPLSLNVYFNSGYYDPYHESITFC
jgi:hypothetical protein